MTRAAYPSRLICHSDATGIGGTHCGLGPFRAGKRAFAPRRIQIHCLEGVRGRRNILCYLGFHPALFSLERRLHLRGVWKIQIRVDLSFRLWIAVVPNL